MLNKIPEHKYYREYNPTNIIYAQQWERAKLSMVMGRGTIFIFPQKELLIQSGVK